MKTFRKARPDDAPSIAPLVNSAYRGDSSRAGWTTEADLLDGSRTDEAEIRDLIATPDSVILVCEDDGRLVGSVHLQKTGTSAYLGLLVVEPGLQGGGVGKQLMEAAEALVREEWGATKMWMTVITIRSELVAFYERRGYRRTGRVKSFPTEGRLSTPVVEGLELEVMEKAL